MGLTSKENFEWLANKKACRECAKKYKAAQKKYQRRRTIFEKLLGYCPCCERYFRWPVKTRRRATQYVNEADNWLTACNSCQEEDDVYFNDLWEQYYGSI